MTQNATKPPRYLRFVRSLALGALVATTGCGGESTVLDSGARADAGTDDASMEADASIDGGGSSMDASIDGGPGWPDAGGWVDGPLHPPDLARRA